MCIGMANGGKQVVNDGKTMLLQRAVESAKNRVYYIDVNSMGDISYHHHKKAENQKELMEITVNALEKQIPKKVKVEQFNRYNLYYCPICDGCIGDSLGYIAYGFCSGCGQRLDWSDTEWQIKM